jgi:hypothetical protein
MRRIAILLVFCLSLASNAHADESSKHAKIQEMFTLLKLDQMSERIMDSVMKQAAAMPQQVFGTEMPATIKPRFEAFQKQLFDLMISQVGWKALQSSYIDLYAQTYTEEEIDAILAFYKSPAGSTMIAKTPELQTKSMELVQNRMAAIQPQLRSIMNDFIRDAKAASETKPDKPAPSK